MTSIQRKRAKAPRQFEKNKKPSATLPDQSLSIQEIQTRFSIGRDVPSLEPHWEDANELEKNAAFIEIDKMNTFERLDLASAISESLEQQRRDYVKAKKKAKLNQEETVSLETLPKKIVDAIRTMGKTIESESEEPIKPKKTKKPTSE